MSNVRRKKIREKIAQFRKGITWIGARRISHEFRCLKTRKPRNRMSTGLSLIRDKAGRHAPHRGAVAWQPFLTVRSTTVLVHSRSEREHSRWGREHSRWRPVRSRTSACSTSSCSTSACSTSACSTRYHCRSTRYYCRSTRYQPEVQTRSGRFQRRQPPRQPVTTAYDSFRFLLE